MSSACYPALCFALRDVHVRALAWLLLAPDLMGGSDTRIGRLPLPTQEETDFFLRALDADPTALHVFLQLPHKMRLGHYAEKLLEFFLRRFDCLYAANVQVHQGQSQTLGEFDFLLEREQGLLHLELATKFYLYIPTIDGAPGLHNFVGPNLADTLHLKLHKILSQQLQLSQHAASRLRVTRPIIDAQAVVKGWLFYPVDTVPPLVQALTQPHCHGTWCTLVQLEKLGIENGTVLPRLQWLAPACQDAAESFENLRGHLQTRLIADGTPQLMVALQYDGERWCETSRHMVVPEGWYERARATMVARNE